MKKQGFSTGPFAGMTESWIAACAGMTARLSEPRGFDLAPIKWTLNEGRSRLILGGVYDVAVSF